MQRCINQAFRPKLRLPPEMRGGRGDCTTCTSDEDNKRCPGYYPIQIFTFEVKGVANAILPEVQSNGGPSRSGQGRERQPNIPQELLEKAGTGAGDATD
jgi:hypothetical protein